MLTTEMLYNILTASSRLPTIGCKNDIATPRFIEHHASTYIAKYEKAFDGQARDSIGKFLRHYCVPNKFVSLICNTYDGKTSKVSYACQLTDFYVKTDMRQLCVLSPYLVPADNWINDENHQNYTINIESYGPF